MRPEIYGRAINRIIINCSYSYYDHDHCKTNYIIADEKLKLKTYENYVDGVLDKEEYLSYKAEYEKQDKDIRAKIQLAEQEKDSFGEAEESYENWIEKFIKYGTLSEVTREIVTELIEKIVVNGDKSIDIVFKYQSPYPVEKQAV